jgi:uncharacterized protein YlzI (FlbEa/FlbD family)
MSENRPDPIFCFVEHEGQAVLVNFYQIVLIERFEDDQISLHLSNGRIYIFRGEQTVTDIIGLIEQFSIGPDGVPLHKFLQKYLPRLQLVKPEPPTDRKT